MPAVRYVAVEAVIGASKGLPRARKQGRLAWWWRWIMEWTRGRC
jgi:hypothetical protein